MDDLESQIREELAAITDVLEDILGRRSRWNGELELSDDPASYGKAMWSGRIAISRAVAGTDLRWRTEIHETLHLFSTGLTPSSYRDFQGWEEGVVEQLQRLLRPHILRSLNFTVAESIFAAVEVKHDYNRFIDALEGIRNTLNERALPFYQQMLATPLKSRSSVAIQAGQQLPSNQFREFQRDFAFAFSILRGD